MNKKTFTNKEIADAFNKWEPSPLSFPHDLSGNPGMDKCSAIKTSSVFSVRSPWRMVRKLKAKVSNIWRKKVTSTVEYKLVKFRLMMLRKLIKRNNGILLFEVQIIKDQYHFKVISSSFATDAEMCEAQMFIYNILSRRVKSEKQYQEMQKVINEANTILNVSNK